LSNNTNHYSCDSLDKLLWRRSCCRDSN